MIASIFLCAFGIRSSSTKHVSATLRINCTARVNAVPAVTVCVYFPLNFLSTSSYLKQPSDDHQVTQKLSSNDLRVISRWNSFFAGEASKKRDEDFKIERSIKRTVQDYITWFLELTTSRLCFCGRFGLLPSSTRRKRKRGSTVRIDGVFSPEFRVVGVPLDHPVNLSTTLPRLFTLARAFKP